MISLSTLSPGEAAELLARLRHQPARTGAELAAGLVAARDRLAVMRAEANPHSIDKFGAKACSPPSPGHGARNPAASSPDLDE